MVAAFGATEPAAVEEKEAEAVSADPAQAAEPAEPKTAPMPETTFTSSKPGSQPKPASFKSRRKWGKKKKWIIAGSTGGFGVGAVVVFLILLASSFAIPNLTQNITELEFSRLSRQFAYSMTRTVNEVLSVQTTDDTGTVTTSLREAIANHYAGQSGFFSSMKGMAVDKILQNLRLSNDIKLNYEKTKFGNLLLKSLTVNGEEIAIPAQKGAFTDFIPGFRTMRVWSGRAAFANKVVSALQNGLGLDSTGAVSTLERGSSVGAAVEGALVGDVPKAGIPADELEKYADETPEEARRNIEIDAVKAASSSEGVVGVEPSGKPLEENIDEAGRDGSQKFNEMFNGTQEGNEALDKAIQKGGVSDDAVQAVDQSLSGNFAKNLLKVGDPLLTLSMTACIVFEGSQEEAGPTTNATLHHQMGTFLFLAALANEQQFGGPQVLAPAGKQSPASQGLGVALGAMRSKLGDISKSNPYIFANGGSVDTSTTSVSAEASPLQTYTLLNTLFGSDQTAQTINAIALKVCPVMTHPITAGVLTALNIAGIIATAGGSAGPEEAAAEVASDEIGGNIATRIAGNIAQKIAAQGLGVTFKRVGLFVGKQAFVVGGTIGLTELAKLIVWANIGMYTGLEQGPEYANEAAAGANGYVQDQLRAQTFAPPMTDAETTQSDTLDKQYIASINASRSFTDRYLAVNNPDSLLMQSANMVYGGYQQAKTNVGDFMANLFTAPIHAVGSLMATVTGSAYAATVAASTQLHYGNVQFGWSKDEQTLIDSDGSYAPLENEKILDDSGERDAIAKEYASCFGYSYDPSGSNWDPGAPGSKLQLDIAGDGSIGTLLASGSIRRTANGDLETSKSFLCSPENLGVNNENFGSMVFRFRLSELYHNNLAQLHNYETITAD